MAKKKVTIGKYLLYGVVAIAGAFAFVKYLLPKILQYIRKKQNVKTPLPSAKSGEVERQHLHDEATYEKILKDNPQLARKWFATFYANAQDSKFVLDTDSQRQTFEEWLRNELKEALSSQNYRKNLYEWLSGQVETPEASIVLNFLKYLQKDRKDFTREVLERLANQFKETLKGRPELKTLPSVLDTQINPYPDKPKTVF